MKMRIPAIALLSVISVTAFATETQQTQVKKVKSTLHVKRHVAKVGSTRTSSSTAKDPVAAKVNSKSDGSKTTSKGTSGS